MKYIILALGSLLFLSCRKYENTDTKSIVKIDGIVIDYKTNLPIEGVSISISVDEKVSKTVKTDRNGYYSLGEYPSTGFSLLFSKDGYLSEYRQNSVFGTAFPLYPLTGKINLIVTKQINSFGSVPVIAGGIPYVISLPYPNLPISGSTDSNGQIRLSNIPDSRNLIISFNYTDKSNITYKQDNVISSNTDRVELYGFSLSAGLALASSNLLDEQGLGVQNFNPADSIVIVFNQPIDTLSANSNINSYFYLPGIASIRHSWSNNNMQLIWFPERAMNNDNLYNFFISSYVRNADKTKILNSSINIIFKTRK